MVSRVKFLYNFISDTLDFQSPYSGYLIRRIIHGSCMSTAMSWTLDGLRKKFGEMSFTVNCPSKKSAEMSLHNFLDYMHHQQDEDPLYLFDAAFGETVPELLDSYEVPAIFRDDFYNVLGTGD